MAKISPVSIKYMIHAKFVAEGALEKPDVIGAIFGQTEGLLGAELEMRELQKEGKIGRIEVELERNDKKTSGVIKIPTALDQSETTLIAAAIETIERMGPSDAQIEIERIEDVRGSKRDYIIERAKKLMQTIEGSTDSRQISNEIKDHSRMANVKEFGEEKLPCGDLSGNEIIVVEGRADVLSLLRSGVNNVVAMNGTKLPESIRALSKEKEITLFVDGDRGGKLIAENVTSNATIKYISVAPDGKEVEELMGKEILMALRKKVPVEEFLGKRNTGAFNSSRNYEKKEVPIEDNIKIDKGKLKEIAINNEGTGKAIILDNSLREIKKVSVKALNGTLRGLREKPYVVIIDGIVTSSTIEAAEDSEVKIIMAKNFATTNTTIHLLSF